MNRRLVQRLFDLERRAQGDAVLLAERLRSLSDDELNKLIAFADARPDLEFLTPEDFRDVLGWPLEKVRHFMSRSQQGDTDEAGH